MSELFLDAINVLGMVANAFYDIWIPFFFMGFLIVVVDVIYYQFMGGDR